MAYVDDVLLISDNLVFLQHLIIHLDIKIDICDLRSLHCFFGIEVSSGIDGLLLS